MSWTVEHHRGGADDLHHLGLEAPGRTVLVMELDHAAVALGSTQSDAVLNPAALRSPGPGRDPRAVTRRHSGGGLVVMNPGEVVWVDVVIPAADPLWRVDVGEAFVWLGRVWAEVVARRLASVDPPPVVHRGAPRHADLGRAVCFAGVGSGEVMVGDRKVVGLSQRRTRDWARFQCLVHGHFDAEDSMSVLAPHLTTGVFGDRLRARLAGGVGVVALDGLVDDLVARLATR